MLAEGHHIFFISKYLSAPLALYQLPTFFMGYVVAIPLYFPRTRAYVCIAWYDNSIRAIQSTQICHSPGISFIFFVLRDCAKSCLPYNRLRIFLCAITQLKIMPSAESNLNRENNSTAHWHRGLNNT